MADLGTYVVDERWRFPIEKVLLRAGFVCFVARLDGPVEEVPVVPRQFVVLGDDGVSITEARVKVGWPAIEQGGSLFVHQTVRIDHAEGTNPW